MVSQNQNINLFYISYQLQNLNVCITYTFIKMYSEKIANIYFGYPHFHKVHLFFFILFAVHWAVQILVILSSVL